MNLPIDFHAILPELIMAGTLLLVLFVDLFLSREHKWWAMPIAFAGTLASLIATLTLIGTTRVTFGGSYVVDDFAILFKLLFTGVALVVLLLCVRYLRDGHYYQGEFYFLLLCSFLGCLTMASSRDLLLLFISLEMVSAPGFLLTGLKKGDPRSNEAALKFFLISVLSTAVMLYGMSLIYGVTGTTRLTEIAVKLAGPAGQSNLALAAILFVVAGFAFKVSAFPFQFWAPDTYEGAPVPVAAFLSVASKAAGFVGLLQLMFHAFLPEAHFWAPIFGILCVFTMFMGNLVALQQRQVVRLFAYSSIAQAGYMLLPFALAGYSASVDHEAFSAVVLYIMVYAVTNLGAFAIVVGMSRESPTLLIGDFDRARPARAGPGHRHGDLPGVPGGYPADRGLLGQVLHLRCGHPPRRRRRLARRGHGHQLGDIARLLPGHRAEHVARSDRRARPAAAHSALGRRRGRRRDHRHPRGRHLPAVLRPLPALHGRPQTVGGPGNLHGSLRFLSAPVRIGRRIIGTSEGE